MSIADLYSTVSALPREDKVERMRFIVEELDKGRQSRTTELFVPPPEDHCPYSPEELAAMYEETGGQPLSEIWRELGRT
jgi:hypothetical protein